MKQHVHLASSFLFFYLGETALSGLQRQSRLKMAAAPCCLPLSPREEEGLPLTGRFKRSLIGAIRALRDRKRDGTLGLSPREPCAFVTVIGLRSVSL